jgi:diguanylate cyclase (GGDEF)-like protein
MDEKRWFIMRVSPFKLSKERFFVISHQNVTERKLAEEAVDKLARLDGLTNIYNRRAFDEFLKEQWEVCTRLNQPMSLAMIDLDHFKLLNDTYGHQAGDDCLVVIGALLSSFASRPGDLCARYGGEEFALIWSNTDLEEAEVMTMQILDKVRALNIPNQGSSIVPYMTASIGLAEMMPSQEVDAKTLVTHADQLLYKAKAAGRNTAEQLKAGANYDDKGSD